MTSSWYSVFYCWEEEGLFFLKLQDDYPLEGRVKEETLWHRLWWERVIVNLEGGGGSSKYRSNLACSGCRWNFCLVIGSQVMQIDRPIVQIDGRMRCLIRVRKKFFDRLWQQFVSLCLHLDGGFRSTFLYVTVWKIFWGRLYILQWSVGDRHLELWSWIYTTMYIMAS